MITQRNYFSASAPNSVGKISVRSPKRQPETNLGFRIYEVEGLYYPCSEKKGADQIRGYRDADLRLCFRRCKKPIFSRRGSIYF